ncbi:hypothetical protein ABXN37_19605 [Piscinibacter sakaiensis]|uniref:Uncharacterized protein n=1 Tax=Piscinibacter sakaiensis TaxID=1547922 RepID=A0A0K8P3Z1_PISS1|nr:hypothetical protein [Piscinibacter sakaiensis]GAP37332.1 hypothetical protein ISF6_3187 [Piscinibacter sakaiensis]
MPCTTINLGGASAIVCTRTRSPRCACGAPATLQCDANAPARRSGTCDRHICATCATEVGPDRHLCPAHRDAAVAPPAPVQGGLF